MQLYCKSLLIASLVSGVSLHAELVKTYFKTGELKAETNYVDGTNTPIKAGIKDGIEKIYYIEGGLAYSVSYKDSKRDSKLIWFDKKGRKIAQMYYKNGKLEGLETSYFENGVIKHTVMYRNDMKEGVQKEYFSNGKLALEVPYKHNKKEGVQKEYTIDGKLYSTVLYKNNYKEGLQKWYDKDGKVVKTELFKMDRPINVMKKVQTKHDEPNVLINSIDFSPKKLR
ncbi:toxin-antitoxin system YwqK family antitoxin [Sulfurimonas sp.]